MVVCPDAISPSSMTANRDSASLSVERLLAIGAQGIPVLEEVEPACNGSRSGTTLHTATGRPLRCHQPPPPHYGIAAAADSTPSEAASRATPTPRIHLGPKERAPARHLFFFTAYRRREMARLLRPWAGSPCRDAQVYQNQAKAQGFRCSPKWNYLLAVVGYSGTALYDHTDWELSNAFACFLLSQSDRQ